jgi:hypothetical protein
MSTLPFKKGVAGYVRAQQMKIEEYRGKIWRDWPFH